VLFELAEGESVSYFHEDYRLLQGPDRSAAKFRQMDRVESGRVVDVERLDRGDYRIVRRATPQNEGTIDWLVACPQKDFFLPIDLESTDSR